MILYSTLSYGQKMTNEKFENEYNILIENLSIEDWAKSELICNKLLEKINLRVKARQLR